MKDPMFCRECGVLAFLSWKLYRPVYRWVPVLILGQPAVVQTAQSEEFEVGWCEEHYRPMPPTAEEVVRTLEAHGVMVYRHEVPVEEER